MRNFLSVLFGKKQNRSKLKPKLEVKGGEYWQNKQTKTVVLIEAVMTKLSEKVIYFKIAGERVALKEHNLPLIKFLEQFEPLDISQVQPKQKWKDKMNPNLRIIVAKVDKNRVHYYKEGDSEENNFSLPIVHFINQFTKVV